jgi:hypothetical protein
MSHPEDLIHGDRAAQEHRAQLVAVDRLGDDRARVSAQVGDVLDAHTAVGEQGHEGVTQLLGRPLLGTDKRSSSRGRT